MSELPASELPHSATVCIITRTRNRNILLHRAVESVLGQKYENWRHIIVNDGGDADALDAFLAEFEARYRGRLCVVHNPEPLGMQAATNAGLEKADGEYVAVHDDDDEWQPEFLTATVGFLEEKGPGSVYQGVIAHTVKVLEDIDAQGGIAEISREPYLPLPDVNLFRVGYENPFPPIAFLYRRSVHDTIGRFDPRFDVAGDMDFNVRFLLHWEIGVIARPLALYHWRRRAEIAGAGNSVTVQANVHDLRFNEFLNHHLREDAKNGGIGLALNAGRQAFTASTRLGTALERLSALQEACETVRQRVEALPGQTGRLVDLKEHLSSVSCILEGDLAPRVSDLKAHLDSLSSSLHGELASRLEVIDSGVGALCESLPPQLSDLKAHLNSLSGLLEERIIACLDGLDGALGSIREGLPPQLADLKAHLNSLSGLLEGEQSQMTDLKAHLASVTDFLGEKGAQMDSATGVLSSLSAKMEEEARRVSGVEERLADHKNHLTSVTDMISGNIEPRLAELRSRQDESERSLAAALASVREELAAWRSEEKARQRGFRLGPIRISWKGRGKKNS